MENGSRINTLLQKYLDGTCTEQERALVEAWYMDLAKERKLSNKLHLSSIEEARIKEQAFTFVQNQKQQKLSYGMLRYSKIAVAAILVCCGTWAWMHFKKQPNPGRESAREISAIQDIPAGSNIATLTTSDGTVIQLDNTKNGLTVGEQLRYADGSLISNVDAVGELQWLELKTPRGGNYKLILEDGTEVWLNAASAIKYPLHFNQMERRVELQGEAYFHVQPALKKGTSERLPFYVVTPRQEIRVLGTQFNVTDYDNEVKVKTTLVEGKVSVKVNGSNEKEVILAKAGDQSVLHNGKLKMQLTDFENNTAWKDGLILLDHTDFYSLIRQLERWYNVDFVFQKKFTSPVVLSGKLPRNSNLSGILNALNINTGLTFTINGRNVIVN